MLQNTLDVTAGQDRRAALLSRLTQQGNANSAGVRQFDQLNSASARTVGMLPAPGLAGPHGMMPAPAPLTPTNAAYPSTPMTGSFSLLSAPMALQQLVLKQFLPTAGSSPTDDITRAAIPGVAAPGLGR